jgi:GABA permease
MTASSTADEPITAPPAVLPATAGPAARARGELRTGALQSRHLTMIAIGGIIGASLFVGSGSVIASAGPAAVLSYAIGGVLVFLVMRMLGEMAVAHPALGSFMEYAREALGERAGFAVGWLYWYFWVGVVAFEAVVGGRILSGWLPAPDWALALGLMLLLTASNLLSARSFGETEFWLASIKVVTIIVFLLVGTLYVLGLLPDSHGSVSNIGADGFFSKGAFPVLQGVVVVIFAYFGTEIVTMAAAESRQPERAVARATNTVVWRIMLFYVGSVALLVMITPWRSIPSTSSPFAAAFDRFGFPAAQTVMQAVVLTAALSVLNSGLYTSSRMLYALGNRGWAPAWCTETSRRGVPWKAILLSTVVGYLAIVMNYISPETVFAFIMNSAGAVALFVYIIITLSQMRLRSRLTREGRFDSSLRMWLHPWLGIATLAGIGVVLAVMGYMADTRSQLLLSLISLGVVLLAYPLTRRSRGQRLADASLQPQG